MRWYTVTLVMSIEVQKEEGERVLHLSSPEADAGAARTSPGRSSQKMKQCASIQRRTKKMYCCSVQPVLPVPCSPWAGGGCAPRPALQGRHCPAGRRSLVRRPVCGAGPAEGPAAGCRARECGWRLRLNLSSPVLYRERAPPEGANPGALLARCSPSSVYGPSQQSLRR